MNWNPYKRIAALEQEVTNLNDELVMQSQMLHDLGVKHKALHNWVVNNPYAAAPVRVITATKAEVDAEAEQKRIKQREYQRVYYAKQRAKARQREYSAAYRARKKAEKAAAQAVGDTA